MQKISGDQYADFVAEGTRLLVVTAAWASHSRSFMPVIEAIEPDLGVGCKVGFVDADSEPELTDTLTKAVPSTHVFVEGREVRAIVGALTVEELRVALAEAGVKLARGAVRNGATTLAPPSPHLGLTEDFVSRAGIAARADREGLAQCIRQSSWIAAYGTSGQVEASVDQALIAIRELPSLIAEVEAAALDDQRRAVYRLGALAGLLYGAATFDGLSDMLPASYGYLDDWLVLSATKWVYVKKPSPAQKSQIADQSRLVWNCLPPPVIPPLMQFVGYMEHECAMLEQLPENQVQAMLEAHLRRPAPMQFVVPKIQAKKGPRDPMGGWTTQAKTGEWHEGRSVRFQFNDGSTVGMNKAGEVVVFHSA